ncbi:MAG TPA: DUF4097 family beta strand repeat-containing protein [Terriglobales bacterium]|jgi:DUF4097 and DUF4098 domain-containing protein YvlB|nr:DUF4097 family beta strand repeat-containing protein [Terriglobales bacterium]
MKRSTCVSSILLLAVCALPAVARDSYQGSFQRSFQVSGPVQLEALTHSGDITVRSGPAGTVSISGKIHMGDRWFSGDRQADVSELEKNPPVRQSGNSIYIDYPNVRNISIDYDVTVPSDTSVHSHTGSGDQRIEGLRGSLDLESGSGDMRLTGITGETRLHTGSGDVDVRDLSGAFSAEAGSGDIRLDSKGGGDVQAHTGSGNIELRGVKGTLRVEAGSGDVSVEGTQTGTWELRTGSGNVDLRLPADAAFDLEASTSSGKVDTSRPVTMTVQGDLQRAHRSLHGKVNGGGPLLTVHTGSGDVRID